MVLCSVDCWMTVTAVGPESTGLVENSPGLEGAAELPVPVVWELSEETVDSDESEMVWTVSFPVRLVADCSESTLVVNTSLGLDWEAALASSVLWEE